MQFAFTPPPFAMVPIVGSQTFFPVHRIYCVGRNYVEHAKEMGGTGREAPFFFMKPADALLVLVPEAATVMHYPAHTANLQHEVELVVAIGKGGKNIQAADAYRHIWGYAIGLDMTRRDLQAEAKKHGRPWCTAKGFDESAPVGPIHPITHTGALDQASIYLNVNGLPRQIGNIDQMVWTVAEIIEILSTYYILQPGDLIMTGTPSGVAAVMPGDVIEAGIEGLQTITLKIIEPDAEVKTG